MSPNILVISDEKATFNYLNSILMEKGYDVDIVSDSDEALKKSRQKTFNLVFIDLKIFNFNGTDLLKNLKESSPEMSCVILTEYERIHKAIDALKMGAEGYFIKPLRAEEVIFRIDRALAWQRLLFEVRENEKKIDQIFNAIPDIFFLVSEDNTILDYRGKREDLYTPPEELIGKKIHDLLPKNVAKLSNYSIKKTLSSGEPQNVEYSLEINNELRFFEARHLKLSKTQVAIFIREITDRKQSEQKLRESEQKFRTIAEQSLMGIVIIQDNLVKYTNGATAQIHGYTPEEVMNWEPGGIKKILHPEDFPKALKRIKEIESGNFGEKTEIYRYITKKEDILWVEIQSKGIIYQGRPATLGLVTNITERKRAEDEIRESEEKYRNLFEKASVGFVVMSKGKIIMCNEKESKIFGYDFPSDLIGKDVAKLVHRDDFKLLAEQQRNIIQGNKMEQPILFRGIHRNGKELFIEGLAIKFPYFCEDCILAFNIDVTEREFAQRKLKESEEKFRNISEQSLIGIIIMQDGKLKYINDAAAEISSFEVQDYLNRSYKDILKMIHPDDLPYVLEQERKYRSGENDARLKYVVRILTKSGDIRWVEQIVNRINYEGKPADLIMATDITKRIATEQDLLESEEKFRTITEQSFLGITIIQEDKIIYANQAMTKILESSIEEIMNFSINNFMDLARSEDKNDFMDRYKIITNKKMDFKPYFSFRLITKSGKMKWIESFDRLISYKGNTAILSTYRDITEKKEAEIELNNYRKKLEKMVENRTAELVQSKESLEVEIYERKKLEEQLIRQYGIISGIKNIFQEALMSKGVDDMASTCIKMAEELTDSEFGFIGELDPENRFGRMVLSIPTKNGDEAEKIKIMGNIENAMIRVFWRKVIKDGSLIVNDPSNHPDCIEIPPWHPPLKNFLGVPLKIGKETIGLIALANKKSDFTNQDKESVESLSIAFIEAVLRKRAEEELQQSEEKFKSIINISQELIIRSDVNGTCTFVNPAAEKFFQKTMDELIGTNFTQYIHPDDLEKVTKGISDILIKGEPVPGFEARLNLPFGTRVVRWNGSLIRDNLGNITGIQATGRDVTELQEELIEKDKLAAVGQLAAGVAHELNTPLANINLTADFILDIINRQDPTPEYKSIKNEIGDIKNQVKFCAQIVQDLLQFSRRLSLNIKKVNLNLILDESLSSPTIFSKIEQNKIKISKEIDEVIELDADKDLLLHVFQNIINNSIYALEDGQNEPEITIKLSKTSDFAILEIVDNGKGIKESDLSRIFEPFFSTKPVGKGSGLGLAICRSIIEKHGGKISVTSTFGRGTRILINLPLKQPK